MRKIFVLQQSQSLNHVGKWIVNGFIFFCHRKSKIPINAHGVSKYEAFCEMAQYLAVYDVDPDGIIADRRKAFRRTGRDTRRSGDPIIP